MSNTNLKTVLITGGSFGLGLAMAKVFAERGFKVFVCGRSQDKLDNAVKECPDLVPIQADISSAKDRERLYDTINRAGAPLDILVNNAAICHAHDYANPFTLAEDRAREEIETNFHAPVELARLFLKDRDLTRDAIIANISTPGAFFALEANPLYSASKAGFHIFSLALAQHLKKTNVQVSEVYPPALATGLSAELDVASEAENGPEAVQEVALKSVDGILAGEDFILPHPQSEQIIGALGGTGKVGVMDEINVYRSAGWDQG